MVECGYRFRFFGDDAVVASRCLGIYSRLDHSFLVASVPTFRVAIHLKRLVAAGYKIALVRQTETAAIRKATKSSGSTQKSTFSRAVVAVFTSSTMIDDDDPSYSDLVQSRPPLANDDEDDVDDMGESEGEGSEENTSQNIFYHITLMSYPGRPLSRG